MKRPNILVILIDDLRFDEFGAGGHPYMQTPHIDRLAAEGAVFDRAFHTTPICSPNRASIVTGQYASRHGIIDNVARGAMSHRLPNYHLDLQKLGYATAHIGKWHMGNDGMPRPGYDHWISYDGHGQIVNPRLNHNGRYVDHKGYITDIMNEQALEWLEQRRKPANARQPWSLVVAHKAVHPDAEQLADGTLNISAQGGYVVAERHRDLYANAYFPPRPNVMSPEQAAKSKPAWAEAFELRSGEKAQAVLEALRSRTQEEIRLRAQMMAPVDEGVGQMLQSLERAGSLDNTLVVFLSDNGFFFGEHGLGPERRFPYEEGIRSPFVVRWPKRVAAGTRVPQLVICQDMAPTFIQLAGGKPGPHIQGQSLVPLLEAQGKRRVAGWRKSFLVEYWAEQAMPWLVGMSYKAVRTDRYKYVHWVNRSRNGELDELYDLDADPFEMDNRIRSRSLAPVRARLQKDLRRLAADALGL